MNFTFLIMPDILLVLLAFAVLIVDLFPSKIWPGATFRIASLGLIAVFIWLCLLPKDIGVLYWGNYRCTPWTLGIKQLLALIGLFTVALSKSYFREGGNKRGTLTRPGEFLSILLFCLAGMFALLSSREWLTFFVGLELATIPLYILTAFARDTEGSEASMKYIFMGSLTTALLLFGISFVYGEVGSLHFAALNAVALDPAPHPYLGLGLLFIFAGLGFKLAIPPFHMWAPDVYQGAPTPVTAFISTASKTAAIAALTLLICGPLEPMRQTLAPMLCMLSVIGMLLGNLGALKQNDFRRFIAYSSIAQAGYILLAFLGDRHSALSSSTYYLYVYAAGNFAVFFVMSIIGQKRTETFSSLHGLSVQSPGLAAVLMLSMFSLAGIPPLAGFLGKFLLFSSAASSGHYLLVFIAAANSVLSFYYYMLIVKAAYITQPEGEVLPLEINFLQRWCLIVLTLAMLVLGVTPWAYNYIQHLMG